MRAHVGTETTTLSNSVQFCLRKLKELEDADSYEFYHDRLVAVVEEMAKRELSPSPIPKLVYDKLETLSFKDDSDTVAYHQAYSDKDWY